METKKTTWDILSSINCNEHTEKKNGLTYLSWAWAWGITKKNFPTANYEVSLFDNKPYLFDAKLGYLVQTFVTIDGERIGMQLPIMDSSNKAQKDFDYTYVTKFGEKQVVAATMFDVNTAIMRCLTKNLAMFGLGHYIYAGEDLPQEIKNQDPIEEAPKVAEQPKIVDTKKIVFNYLSNNAAALKYYQELHLFRTFDELTEKQINEIYEQLKNKNKL